MSESAIQKNVSFAAGATGGTVLCFTVLVLFVVREAFGVLPAVVAIVPPAFVGIVALGSVPAYRFRGPPMISSAIGLLFAIVATYWAEIIPSFPAIELCVALMLSFAAVGTAWTSGAVATRLTLATSDVSTSEGLVEKQSDLATEAAFRSCFAAAFALASPVPAVAVQLGAGWIANLPISVAMIGWLILLLAMVLLASSVGNLIRSQTMSGDKPSVRM